LDTAVRGAGLSSDRATSSRSPLVGEHSLRRKIAAGSRSPASVVRRALSLPCISSFRTRPAKSIAVEPVDGTLKVTDAPLGVMTNAPTYDWHMTNLDNYINL
jgi:hypothetical protein